MSTVYINGKFTAQQVTGVQRVAARLLNAIDECLSGSGEFSNTRWVLLCPPGGSVPALRHVEVRRLGWKWPSLHLWEQVTLPLASRGGVLLSLSGSAPALKRRQICTFHDAAVFDCPEAYTASFATWYRLLFKRLSVTARLILTVSEFSKRRLMAHLSLANGRIVVVRSGAEHLADVAADASILERLRVQSGKFFVAVGSDNPTKNHEAMIRAFQALPPELDLCLVIAGGTRPGVFASRSGLQVNERVIRTGPVTDGQLKALYQRAAGLVFPSTYEGYGLPPLEAMSCGCPVLASNAASIPEVCAEAALYFDPHSQADITNAMTRLIDEPQLRERLQRSGAQRASELTWQAAGRTLLSHLRAVGVTESFAR